MKVIPEHLMHCKSSLKSLVLFVYFARMTYTKEFRTWSDTSYLTEDCKLNNA